MTGETDGSAFGRRKLLAAAGLTIASGVVFRDELLGADDPDDGRRSDDESAGVDEALTAHLEYRRETAAPTHQVDFEYDRINVRETRDGDAAVLRAVPDPERPGDRIVVSPPESMPAEDVARGFVAYWGAPVDHPVAEATISGSEVTFYGGAGVDVAAAAATTDTDDGASVLAVRGESLDVVGELAVHFEDGNLDLGE